MDQLSLPQSITSEVKGVNTAKIVIEPCYPGYGTTLGNALRRVLLSSLPGAACTAVKITGVDHEFSTISGVQEDVVDLILNIKQLRFKIFSNEPVILHLKVSGEKVVKGKDIEKNSQVEITNPDWHLATLTDKKSVLEIELTVQAGRGYVAVETREKERLPIGTIAVDAIYTPVKRVGYTVENARVGQMTNYDKLLLDVETDGTIEPLAAVQQAADILIQQLDFIRGDKTNSLTNSTDNEAVATTDVTEFSSEEVKPAKKRGRPKKDTLED